MIKELEAWPPMDRSKWKRVRFGDVVRCVDKTCRDPQAEGLTRVVGLEHLDPGELKITRWADVADGTSFTRTFKAGQVLFGKRRAYQRKAAMADFDGICSGDILVLEAESNTLEPSLLPYIAHSKAFIDFAVRTSAGSLSPRTKWKDLADFSFSLPSLSEQSKMAFLLNSFDFQINAYREVIRCLELVVDRCIHHSLSCGNDQRDCQLGDILNSIKYGSSKPAFRTVEEGTPVLRIPNVLDGRICTDDLKYTVFEPGELSAFSVVPGDVLVVRTNGNPQYVGRSALVTDAQNQYGFASYLIRLRPNQEVVVPDYLNWLLATPEVVAKMKQNIRSSAGNYNINSESLKQIPLRLPTISVQKEIVKLQEFRSAVVSQANGCISNLQLVKEALLNSYFWEAY